MFKLKKATINDCKLIFKWANDPQVRRSSFSPEPISWSDHVEWFETKHKDPNCFILIAIDDKCKPIGQIRFETGNTGEAIVNVSIDKRMRGLGLGSLLIRLGVEEIFRISPLRSVQAFIKLDNKVSIRAFEKAGFKRQEKTVIKGIMAEKYIITKNNGFEKPNIVKDQPAGC